MAEQDTTAVDPTKTSSSNYSFGPAAPKFLDQAGETAGELKTSAVNSADAQQKRLNDYIQHLYRVRELAKMAAKGGAARGAGGQQNPLAVYRGMSELARQAGIPVDAEIQKVLQGSNNIENTMNQLIGQAGSLQAQLASIQKGDGSGVGNISIGGNRNAGRGTGQGGGQGNGQGQGGGYKNIRGDTGGPEVMQGSFTNPGNKGGGTPGWAQSSQYVTAGPQGRETLEYLERSGSINPQQQQALNQMRGQTPSTGGMFNPMTIGMGQETQSPGFAMGGTSPQFSGGTEGAVAGANAGSAGGQDFNFDDFHNYAASMLPGYGNFMNQQGEADLSGFSESQSPQFGSNSSTQPHTQFALQEASPPQAQQPTQQSQTWGDVNPFGSGNVDWGQTWNDFKDVAQAPSRWVNNLTGGSIF